MAFGPQAAEWYVGKAAECERMAKETRDPYHSGRYLREAKLWRSLAEDIQKKEKPES